MVMSALISCCVVLGTIVFSTALPTSTTEDVETTTVDEVTTLDSEAQTREPRILNRLPNGRLPPECNDTPCIPKCCPIGKTYVNRSCVSFEEPFDPFVDVDVENGFSLRNKSINDYFIVVGKPCQDVYDETDSVLWVNGSLLVYNDPPNSTEAEYWVDKNKYCVEYTDLEKTHTSFICFPDQIKEAVTSWLCTFGLMLSVTCLILTLIIYSLLDVLRDLHGKSLICHVGSLAISYFMLVTLRVSGHLGFGVDACRSVGFTLQFFLLCSYMWLHAMIVDSMWAVLHVTGHSPFPYPGAKLWIQHPNTGQWITGLAIHVDEEKEEETRRREKNTERYIFCFFAFYVLIFSFLPISVFLSQDLPPIIPAIYIFEGNNEPEQCRFNSFSSLHYFYPVPAFFTVFNIIMFIVILVYAVPFQWNLSGLQRVPKQKARMCFLLFLLMSSNWIIEMVSLLLKGSQSPLQVLRGVYVMQGTITFVIFIMEERVKDRIINKLLPRFKRKINQMYDWCHKPTNQEVTEHHICTTISENQTMGFVVPK